MYIFEISSNSATYPNKYANTTEQSDVSKSLKEN